MAIQQSELKYYRSETFNDTSSNGGRMSASEVAVGVKNNVFPDISQSQRAGGYIDYRKIFFKIANPDGLRLINPMIYVERPTPGESRLAIFAGTQSDTQADLTGSERLYGAGWLDADASIGATSIDVTVEAAADNLFQAGDTIRISNQDGVNGARTEEFLEIESVTWNGDLATLTFANGKSLLNGYDAADTRVASCLMPASNPADASRSIRAFWDAWDGSTAGGTYDGAAPPTAPSANVPLLDNIGAIEQVWTFTFSDATNFTAVGSTVGNVGGGAVDGVDFVPVNPNFARPYFTLPAAGWGGTWAAGDVLTFATHPAAFPVWWKRIIPAGADSISADNTMVAITGESP